MVLIKYVLPICTDRVKARRSHAQTAAAEIKGILSGLLAAQHCAHRAHRIILCATTGTACCTDAIKLLSTYPTPHYRDGMLLSCYQSVSLCLSSKGKPGRWFSVLQFA